MYHISSSSEISDGSGSNEQDSEQIVKITEDGNELESSEAENEATP